MYTVVLSQRGNERALQRLELEPNASTLSALINLVNKLIVYDYDPAKPLFFSNWLNIRNSQTRGCLELPGSRVGPYNSQHSQIPKFVVKCCVLKDSL